MRIGALTPVWNQERFIKAHLEMMTGLDKIVVILNEGPLGEYEKQHGFSKIKDRTEEIVKTFSNVETHVGTYRGEFSGDLYNQGLKYVQDCDIVFKLDPDFYFTKKDWSRLIDFIRSHDYDCYRMDYSKCSINYYGIDRFDLGCMDALEKDEIIAFSPKKEISGVRNYNARNSYQIDWDNFVAHHLRGWKPSSSTPNWEESPIAKFIVETYNKDGRWIKAPQEIIDKLK